MPPLERGGDASPAEHVRASGHHGVEHGAQAYAAVVEAAAAKRAEILKSLAGRKLNTTIEYSNQEIDHPKTDAPHLLCNFRMKYVTSSQMVETSKLAMQGRSVALRSDGSWPTPASSRSRLGRRR